MTRMENMEAYCRWEIDQKLRRQVEAWIADGKAEEMSNRFDRRLEFGTAGLRAQMGAGLDRMNSVTVMQATQGVAKFLEEKLGVAEVKQRGVAVGFDARHNSELFAAVTAMVFLTRGIRVWFHPAPVPTPIVAYTAKCKKAAGAIVITASHNPKDDNGYKLYGDDACQIIAPQDTQIQSLIEKNQEVSRTCSITNLRHQFAVEIELTYLDDPFKLYWTLMTCVAMGGLQVCVYCHSDFQQTLCLCDRCSRRSIYFRGASKASVCPTTHTNFHTLHSFLVS